ncbi:hypothetical protein ACOMHN_062638 [Nucella lapillus]
MKLLLQHHGLVGLSLLILASLASQAASQTTACKPGENCSPPNCRCWNDRGIPGGYPVEKIPQVVMLTFEYAVNNGNVDQYLDLFKNLVNPNNCPAVGTFFVQELYSDMAVVKSLSDNGHEIGVTSIDGKIPGSTKQWRDNLKEVRQVVSSAGVPEKSIIGVRAPDLKPGGLEEFLALSEEGFLYDASCATVSLPEDLDWPYTYDFVSGPKCDNGETPEKKFPGKWQVLVSDLEYNGTKCASPSACPGIKSQREAFDLFYNSFITHYEGMRSPFMIVINPQWVAVDFQREGTHQFLEYINAAFEDTWILTVTQALEWVRSPVPNANATAGAYAPWNCAKKNELFFVP